MPLEVPKRILVIQTAFLGDLILSIPLFKELKRNFPDSELVLVCRSGFGELFVSVGLVSRVIEVNKKNRQSLKHTFSQMRAFGADLVVSPHRSLRTALWVSMLKAPLKVGFRDWWTFFAYNIRVPYESQKHDVLRQLSLLSGMGLAAPSISPSDDIGRAADNRELDTSLRLTLKGDKKYSKYQGAIALSPGSQWNTKRWTLDGFAETAAHFAKKFHRPLVLLGTNGEKELTEELVAKISSLMLGKSPPEIHNLCGQTSVLELAEVLKQCSLLVCNDSGTMHVAAAVGTPVVTVFGPTVLSQGYAPWTRLSRVAQVDLPCRPCGAHGHQSCPLGTHACMKKVTAGVVIAFGEDLIK